MKQSLSANETKLKFVQSVHTFIMQVFEKEGFTQYQDCFKLEGSSIMCYLPENFFTEFSIPANTKIEMKFITKKS